MKDKYDGPGNTANAYTQVRWTGRTKLLPLAWRHLVSHDTTNPNSLS